MTTRSNTRTRTAHRTMKFFKKKDKSKEKEKGDAAPTTLREYLAAKHNVTDMIGVLEIESDVARTEALQFVATRHVAENALFWLAHRRLEAGTASLAHRAALAARLFEQFVAPDAPLELNLPDAARRELRKAAAGARQTQLGAVFDTAQREAVLMLDEYFGDFCDSEYGTRLLAHLRGDPAAAEEKETSKSSASSEEDEDDDDSLEGAKDPRDNDADKPWYERPPSRTERRLKKQLLADVAAAAENGFALTSTNDGVSMMQEEEHRKLSKKGLTLSGDAPVARKTKSSSDSKKKKKKSAAKEEQVFRLTDL